MEYIEYFEISGVILKNQQKLFLLINKNSFAIPFNNNGANSVKINSVKRTLRNWSIIPFKRQYHFQCDTNYV